MSANYKYIKKKSSGKSGLVLCFNEDDFVLHKSSFSLINMDIDNQQHITVIFENWVTTTFDGSKDEVYQQYKKEKHDIILLCIYKQGIFDKDFLNKIKYVIGKKIINDIK